MAGYIMFGSHMVSCIMFIGNKVSVPFINTIISAAAACDGVHLSEPLHSHTNWLSSAVTCHSGIPLTHPPRPLSLSSTSCGCSESCTLLLPSSELIWSLTDSSAPTILACWRVLLHLLLPLWLTASINSLKGTNITQKAAGEVTLKDESSWTNFLLCAELWKEKQWSWGGKSWAECQLTSKREIKKTLGYVSRSFYTKAFSPLSTYFQRAWDTWALISVRQGPLSWQFFQRRLNLHLGEYVTLSSLLSQNKRLLK